MKKILLATMVVGMTTGLIGCTRYQIVPADSVKNNDTTKEQVVTQNNATKPTTESNNAQTTTPNNISQSQTNSGDVNANTKSKYTMEQAKEIALKHANLTSDQVMFGKCVMDYEYGTQSYEIEFYKDYLEYSYEINANTGEIISFEQD